MMYIWWYVMYISYHIMYSKDDVNIRKIWCKYDVNMWDQIHVSCQLYTDYWTWKNNMLSPRSKAMCMQMCTPWTNCISFTDIQSMCRVALWRLEEVLQRFEHTATISVRHGGLVILKDCHVFCDSSKHTMFNKKYMQIHHQLVDVNEF